MRSSISMRRWRKIGREHLAINSCFIVISSQRRHMSYSRDLLVEEQDAAYQASMLVDQEKVSDLIASSIIFYMGVDSGRATIAGRE